MEYSGRVQVLDSGDLLISNVRETDAGLYACLRSNEAGTVNGQAFLGVMGKCVLLLKKSFRFRVLLSSFICFVFIIFCVCVSQ